MQEELVLFDSNCMLGRSIGNQGSSYDDLDALHRGMERYCILKAMVFESSAKYYVPHEGNLRLVDLLEGQTGLWAQWVALPHYTGEFPSPSKLLPLLKKHRVASIRLCPVTHQFTIGEYTMHALLDMLDTISMPVFLDYDVKFWRDELPWGEIYALCMRYSRVNFVVVRLGCGDNRDLYAVMDKCPNLLFETSYYAVNRGIEAVCKHFGAQRMLFGSAAPIYTPACPIGMLYYSNVSDEDKRSIACGNLTALIGGIRYDQ